MTLATQKHKEMTGPTCLVVIPCLNEAETIVPLLDQFARKDMVIVADAGSTDGTRDLVREVARSNPYIELLDNPARLQAAGINRAVDKHANGAEYLIRVDAHGAYPPDYRDRLVEEADRTGADSVVVSMATEGDGLVQRAAAVAQNSHLGNGGSLHRNSPEGGWVDHGHHALMRLDAFRDVGGYDESFSHNEDAELDHRLRKAGYRIWLTDKTRMTYFPRANIGALFRQYMGYGRGRARNLLKHRSRPRLRQLLPLLIVPAVVGAGLAFLSLSALVPAGLWMFACLGYGFWMGVARRQPLGPLAAFLAIVMHVGWSAGFWLQLLGVNEGTVTR